MLAWMRHLLLLLLVAPTAFPCVGAESRQAAFRVLGVPPSLPVKKRWILRSILAHSSLPQADTRRAIQNLRGGAEDADGDESDAEESDDEEEDEDDDVFNSFVDRGEEDHFEEETMIKRFIQAYHKTPPLTKAYLTASFAATCANCITGQNDFPAILALDWGKVISRLQIWRPFTAFLNFGSLGFGYFMTIHFVWSYMSTLERLFHNTPYDNWIMIGFGMVSMLAGYPVMRLNARFLGHNLSTYLVYVWSRYHEGVSVGVFDLFTVKAELLPWFLVLQVSQICSRGIRNNGRSTLVAYVRSHCSRWLVVRASLKLVRPSDISAGR
jgi:Der1-like family